MLSTERLTLVPHRVEHFDAYAEFYGKDPGHFLRSLAPMRPEDAWARLLRQVGHWTELGYGPFLGFASDGKLVAEVGYMDAHRGLGSRFDSAPEGMWKIDLDAQGWGLATEAMTATTAWLDTTPHGSRTVCMIDPDNLVSIRVAQKLGFVEFDRTSYRDVPVILYERITVQR